MWTGDRLVVEPLTPLYDLTVHWTDVRTRNAIASTLDAFTRCVTSLNGHYQKVLNGHLPPPHRSFPYKCDYEQDGHIVNFRYTSRVLDKLVFIAKSTSLPSDLCVKFTRRYSAETHQFFAELGHAPKLRAVHKLPGEWYMIAMDYSHFTPLHEMSVSLTGNSGQLLQSEVCRIVRKLHDGGLVHGDIRQANILVDRTSLSGGGVRWHMVDFDWSGKIGETRYPARINRKTVWRLEGVSDGELVSTYHDMAMVEHLFDGLDSWEQSS